MNKVNRIVVSLAFADIILPVSKNEQGEDIVPLKPVSELFGLTWEKQRVRVNKTNWAKRLGTCTNRLVGAGQGREMTCIRLNRVTAYLNSINPENVRAQGNSDGADFLEQKQEEWDNVLHEYEIAGGVFNKNESLKATVESRLRRDYLAILKDIRNSVSDEDKAVLKNMAKDLAQQLGFPYKDKKPVSA